MWDFLWRGVPSDGTWFPTLFLGVAGVIFVAAVLSGGDSRGAGAAASQSGTPFARSTLTTLATAVALAAIGVPAVYTQFGVDTANTVAMLRSGQLSRADAAMLEKGYYEDLTRVNRFNSELWQLYMNRPVFSWLDVMEGAGLGRFTGDFLQQELMPGFRAATPYGTIETNRWGMRDRDYEKSPPAGSVRLAMLGASTVMGWGVEANESFESLLEAGLNASDELPPANYEVLNFGVPGYFPLQLVPLLDKTLEFEPDAVVYVATGRELSRTIEYLADVAIAGIEIPYAYLRDVVANAEVTQQTDRTTALKRLASYRSDVTAWQYRFIAERTKESGAIPIWVFLPQLTRGSWQEETQPAIELAEAAGFSIINLDGVFDERTAEELQVAEWDAHPNALGHRLIAERLVRELASSTSPLHRISQVSSGPTSGGQETREVTSP
jgi:hypothetical protein